jgi:hypothetical protein
MKKNLSYISSKELRNIFAGIVASKKNRKGLLIFDNETKRQYKEWYLKTASHQHNENIQSVFVLLPKRLPSLPKNYETFIAIAGVMSPIILSIIFYWIQANVFFATLIAISTTPLLFLIFFISNKIVLEKQDDLTMNLSKMIDLLKS